MKQIIQSLKNGDTLLEEIPAPIVRKGHLLIRTTKSLVSLGTEKMLVEFGKSSLIAKARQQPDKVKQVLDKIKSDGLLPTLEAVFNKLDEPLPLGYCNVGVVVEVGEGVSGFKIGDRVASNGAHAEFVCVPKHLCAKVPEQVTDEEAAFTVIAAIGLQGIRLVNPTIGETVVVTGLGLIGLITAELLIANGCRVIGLDVDENKINLAKEKGVLAYNVTKIEAVKLVEELTEGAGADAVIITASSKSNDIISQSAQMSRKKGRIVLVGVIGLDISRADFFKKELSFQVSCSYGPGRYDDVYENQGIDYPLPYVRWTEQRNFETVLQLIATQKLKVESLITERFDLADYMNVYGNMGGGSIASILNYPVDTPAQNVVMLKSANFNSSRGVLGIIGAGNFTKMTLLPMLKKTEAKCKYIVSASGVSGTALAKKYHFTHSATDYTVLLADPELDLVMITTRHNLHSRMAVEALKANKHVFVEKPMALNSEELQEIIDAVTQFPDKSITVGFNRRFSPYTQKMKQLMGNANSPVNMIATMNAGFIPADVWVQDLKIGGGRIIGEACHFIDLMIYLSGSLVKSVHMSALGISPDSNTDNAIITLKFENGSQGVINYFSNGNKAYSKERVEVYTQGRTLIMDNFRTLKAYGFKGFSSMTSKQDKGHQEQFNRLIKSIQHGGESLIPFHELVNTTQASFAAIQSMQTNGPVIL